MMKTQNLIVIVVLVALLFSATPGRAQAFSVPALPPVDMFQLPWEEGLAWIAMDAFDNGTKRLTNSPHYYKNGGAIDFAPHVNMRVGEDTSNYWVAAAAAGTVTEVTSCIVKIQHADGWRTEYWHLDKIQVQPAQVVSRNQRLGVIADNIHKQVCVGNEWPGPHMHFVLRPNMVGATFAGWQTAYNPLTNRTTFTKNGVTLGTFTPLLNQMGAQVILREQITWDTLYNGNVDNNRFEKWPFQFTEQNEFTLTTAPAGSDLVALLRILDANGNELMRGTGQIHNVLPAGSYFLQVEPSLGSGAYTLMMQRVQPLPEGPSSSIDADTSVIPVGGTAALSVRLNEVPAEGYTSAEFTCSTDPALIEIQGNFADKGLFGQDAVLVSNWPQSGDFVVAIAGSSGRRATTSGPVFTFSVKALQAGQAQVQCHARVSKGDSILTTIPDVGITLNITGAPIASGPDGETGAGISTTAEQTDPAPVPQSSELDVPAAPAEPDIVTVPVSGTVLASKPVTIFFYNPDASLAASTTAGWDGTFSLSLPAATYTVVASADGFLPAQGSATLAAQGTLTMPTIDLLAGDINRNNEIDPYDVMTIGMNYNTSMPAAADLNNDGNINVLDLEILAKNYRVGGSLLWE